MLTSICLSLILLGILGFSIISEARVALDLYNGGNSLSFYLFGIKVITIDAELIKADDTYKLELRNKDKTIASIGADDIDRKNPRETFRKALPNPFYNLDIVEIEVDAEYGGDNALRTAILSLAFEDVLYGALLYIHSTQRVRARAQVKPNFASLSANLRLSSIFSITIADIIYGLIFGKKGEKKNDIGK